MFLNKKSFKCFNLWLLYFHADLADLADFILIFVILTKEGSPRETPYSMSSIFVDLRV